MTVAENFRAVKKDIARIVADHCRTGDVELVVICKKQSVEMIEEALATGQRVFGENRVQEAQEHWEHLRLRYTGLQLHLVGPLQTNKAKDAVALFDVIQTVDRPKLAATLSKEMHEQRRLLPCFIQVNTGEEAQKSGISPIELSDFLEFCVKTCRLKITGLMCIPPLEEPPGFHFSMLQRLAHTHNLKHLSMGMSSDYEKAIGWGATHLRIGTALFGGREDEDDHHPQTS
ncbi:MAG: YggS family pyridoxal phosphate-dependent enzyme [Alphaproteobacteria bacterium]